MSSKVLVKLIDQAVIPAAVLLATRVISIIVISKKLGLVVHVSSFGLSVSKFGILNSVDYIKINSYSLMSMIMVLSIGVFYVLLKSFIFHDTHITPYLTARLFSFRLSPFIQSSFEIYSQGTIWLSYLYLLLFTSGIMSYFNLLYDWVFIATLAFSLLATLLIIYDVEREITGHLDSSFDTEDGIYDTNTFIGINVGGKDA